MKAPARIVVFAAFVGVVLSSGCKPATSERAARFAKLPYLQNPGQTEMTVRWTTTGPVTCTIRYGVGGSPMMALDLKPFDWAHADPEGSEREYLYRARLTGLTPGTQYRYTVKCEAMTIEGTFRPAPPDVEPFVFIAYGDSRTQTDVHAEVASCFPQHRPAFIIHTGDMVSTGPYFEWQKQLFDPLAEVLRNVPLWPARGNHEGDAVAFTQLFELPNALTYYSFDYANAHFVCLDSTRLRDEEMVEWCAKDLAASRATWKFVFFHDPAYDGGRHRSQWGRDNFLPIFRKHGVDFVLSGHSHSYQRFRPMFTRGENEERPITHVVTAGGGAPLYTLRGHPYLAAAESAYHYVVFYIDGDRLFLRALRPDGTEIDALAVTKSGGRFNKEYLAEALPEDEFDKKKEESER